MRIVCDLLSTIMPPLRNPLEDFRHPDYPPLFRFLDPVAYTGPAKTTREEDEDDA